MWIQVYVYVIVGPWWLCHGTALNPDVMALSQAIVAGGLAAGSTALLPQTMLPAAYVFCAIMRQEITMDINDAEGVAAAGMLTLPVVLGVDVARIYSKSVEFQS